MNDWRVQAVQEAKEELEKEGIKFIPGQQFTREFIMSNDELVREFNIEGLDGDDLEELIQEKVDELEEFISANYAEQFQLMDEYRWLKKPHRAAEVRKKPQDEPRVAIDQETLERLLNTPAESWTPEDVDQANKTINLLSQDGKELEAKKLALILLKHTIKKEKPARELISIQETVATLSEKLDTHDATDHFYDLAEAEWKDEQFSNAQTHFRKAVDIGEKHYQKLCKTGKKAQKPRKEFERSLLLVYRRARKLAREEGDSKVASSLYVKECKLQCRNEEKLCKRLACKAYGLFANHGESPLRVGLWAAASILVFAVLYCWINAELPAPEKDGNQFCVGIEECTYYSTVTFSTLGYGELVPTEPLARFIASIQALLGLMMTSLFIATFFKRYSRE